MLHNRRHRLRHLSWVAVDGSIVVGPSRWVQVVVLRLLGPVEVRGSELVECKVSRQNAPLMRQQYDTKEASLPSCCQYSKKLPKLKVYKLKSSMIRLFVSPH